MDPDNRREPSAQEPGSAGVPARVQPPGPSMTEWRATIERQITGRMPFPNKYSEVINTDRAWNGPGIYGDHARLAASTLRAEYLSDHDLVADRWGLAAVRLSPEGVHVRVRAGTTGIPDHLYGCPITVEYVDLPSQTDVAAASGEVTAVVDRLQSEMPGCVVLTATGHIRLQPWAVPVAEELNRRFGDLLELRVGWLRYPPERQPPRPPMTREVPEILDARETEAELDGHAVVNSGHTLWHGLRLHNLGDRELLVATTGQVTADVVDPQTGEVVGGYAGPQRMPGVTFRAAPGRTTRIPLLIGTASSTLRLGYAVPPGNWGLQVTLTLGHDARAPRRRTPILPLTITGPDQTFQPRMPRHRLPRHRHPGQASS